MASIMASFCFVCGAFGLISLVSAWSSSNKANEVAALPTTIDVAIGKRTALTGILDGNSTIKTDPDIDNIAQYELVAYEVQTYRTSNSRNTSGSWTTTRKVVESLAIDINGQPVNINPDQVISLGGDMQEFPATNLSTVRDGSKRVRGFRNGDRVTIIAVRDDTDTFLAQEVYGGTRDDLVSNTRTGGVIFRYAGYIMIGMGGAVGAIGLLFLALILRNQ